MMAKYCAMCGSPIPNNQGSTTCSMCYGDIGHGKDGYYRREIEREEERKQEQQDAERQWEDEHPQ